MQHFSKAFRDVRLPYQITSDFHSICAIRKPPVSAFKWRKVRQNPMRSDRVNQPAQWGPVIKFRNFAIGFGAALFSDIFKTKNELGKLFFFLHNFKTQIKQKNILTQVIGCPTIREENGLAKSSRNQHLSKLDREQCGVIYKQLLVFKHLFEKMDISELKNQIIINITNGNKIRIEYLELVNLDTFKPDTTAYKKVKYAVCIAVSISGVRLIDNIIL